MYLYAYVYVSQIFQLENYFLESDEISKEVASLFDLVLIRFWQNSLREFNPFVGCMHRFLSSVLMRIIKRNLHLEALL